MGIGWYLHRFKKLNIKKRKKHLLLNSIKNGGITTEDEARLELEHFSEKWDDKYPQISRSWRIHWENLNTLFSYPEDIAK